MCEGIFNEMQIIFSTLSGCSCHAHWWKFNVLRSMGVACIYSTNQANTSSLKKRLSYVVYSTLECYFSVPSYLEALCSLQNACYSHRVQYIRFPPMGVTGSWPELPHMVAWNPPIQLNITY